MTWAAGCPWRPAARLRLALLPSLLAHAALAAALLSAPPPWSGRSQAAEPAMRAPPLWVRLHVQEPAAPAVAAPSRRPPVQTTPPASPQQVPPSPTPTPTAVAPVVLQPPSAVAARPSRTAWAVHEAEPSASADPTAAASAIAAPAISAEAAAATHAAQPLPLPLRVARPDHSHCPPAAYPALLRERGIEGVVQVRVRVGADGSAAEAVLDKGSGFRLFDEAAVQRALGCRFVPARRGTESIESWVDFPVRFALIG